MTTHDDELMTEVTQRLRAAVEDGWITIEEAVEVLNDCMQRWCVDTWVKTLRHCDETNWNGFSSYLP